MDRVDVERLIRGLHPVMLGPVTLGAAPGSNEAAPLALRFRAKGQVDAGLGQRPLLTAG